MATVHWEPRFSVRIKDIDDQHRQLLAMINQLAESRAGRHPYGQWHGLEEVLLQMSAYLEDHFSTEERYMLTHEYPGYQAHCEEHLVFIEKVDAFVRDQERGRTGLSVEVRQFLQSWLLNHIMHVDARLGSFLAAKGLV